MLQSLSEWQRDKVDWSMKKCQFFDFNWLPWQLPLRNRKNWTWSRKFMQIPSIWWKKRENRPSRYWDSFAHSKKNKKEEINAAKYIALSASLPSGCSLSDFKYEFFLCLDDVFLWIRCSYYSPTNIVNVVNEKTALTPQTKFHHIS